MKRKPWKQQHHYHHPQQQQLRQEHLQQHGNYGDGEGHTVRRNRFHQEISGQHDQYQKHQQQHRNKQEEEEEHYLPSNRSQSDDFEPKIITNETVTTRESTDVGEDQTFTAVTDATAAKMATSKRPATNDTTTPTNTLTSAI